MNLKKWVISPLNKERAAHLAEEYNLPFFLSMMLEIRGARGREEIEELLGKERELSDPFRMPDMEKAVGRIRTALERFEKIAVYGDYDADGVTATAMLYSYLDSCGANVLFYIPDREGEGYGMNMGAVDSLHEQRVGLIITVDNGITSIKEAAYAESLGIDLVITDHHRPLDELPKACAVVDPYRRDCDLPFRDFAGVGVALQLIMALEGGSSGGKAVLENYADLAAIGTIGDVVPLNGENRALVREGLRLLSRSDRVGVRALLEHAGMAGKKLSAVSVAFTVVPRINATGRIGSPDRAVRLLVSEDPQEAEGLAADICDDNEFRRQIEAEILEKALQLLQSEPSRLYDRVLVVSGENWHHGVIGIVAARLTEQFGKPCMVISSTGEEARGSGRSIEGFDLFEALCSCQKLFTKFGGHSMAAGISLQTRDIERFREAVNHYAAAVPAVTPVLRLDCKLNPAALSVEMPQLLELLEPFGTGNPEPRFGLYGMQLRRIVPVGGGKHLRLVFTRGTAETCCMLFRTEPKDFPYRPGDTVDLAVSLDGREYRGEKRLSVIIRDIRPSGMDIDALLLGKLTYEKYKRGERLTEKEAALLLPSYGHFAALYRFLRTNGGWRESPVLLLYRLNSPEIGYGRLMVALEVFAEHGLLTVCWENERLSVNLCSAGEKVDLFRSEVLDQINLLQKDGAEYA
ncbi:Single-stranded-DNA-specific exonuclease RecJ [Ruminococcaceae bacterium BL-6]|nr:Single-stranded-DNA-specific exonuclease RecJ [Ruminococcaceae bacterium BL-6]